MFQSVIEELQAREFIFQMTETKLPEIAKNKQFTVYCGFDPTAPSLHLGHVVPIMALAHFQRYGGTPIFLIGGGTAQIGDPSGKQSERKLLSKEEINHNASKVKQQLSAFLSFDGPNKALILNNAEWLEKQTLIDFLRHTAKHFSLGSLLAKESIKNRLSREQGISITEFLYALLQSYDFLHLYKNYGCVLQIGGSDQWGNITAGVDFIRRTLNKEAHGLTFPLLTKADGSKFGKTEDGAIWLDPEMTSPYEMYQYWINTDDRDVIRFLKLFTFIDIAQIEELCELVREEPEKRKAQQTLAFEFSKLVHEEGSSKACQSISQLLFGYSNDVVLSETSLEYLKKVIPSLTVEQKQIHDGILVSDAIVMLNLCTSKSAAKRLLEQGGVYLKNKRIGEDRLIALGDAYFKKYFLFRLGKKKYSLLHL